MSLARPHLLLIALLGLACAGSEEPLDDGVVDLIDNTAWVQVDAVDDIFADRPADPACPPDAPSVEPFGAYRETLELNTNTCAYFAGRQPLQADILAGDTLILEYYHFALTAPGPAEAHVALAVNGEILFEDMIPIPAGISGFLRPGIIATEDISAGVPVDFHLHNHGDNTYGLLRFSAGPPREF